VRAPSTRGARPATLGAVEPLREGQPVWVEQEDGSQRAAVYVGSAEVSTWFGGESSAYVVYPDAEHGEQVSAIRVVPREPDDAA
jgi:hypothetical protein